MYFGKSMKEYVERTKLKIPSSRKPYYKAITGLTCQRTPSSSSKGALSVNSLHGSHTNLPTFSTKSEVHDPLQYGEWISWDHSQFPRIKWCGYQSIITSYDATSQLQNLQQTISHLIANRRDGSNFKNALSHPSASSAAYAPLQI